MASSFSDFRSEVNHFLASLIVSFENTTRLTTSPGEDRERYLQIRMIIEEARVRFGTFSRFRGDPSVEEWLVAREELLAFTNNFFLQDPSANMELYQDIFREGARSPREQEGAQPTVATLLSQKRVTIEKAMHSFISFLHSADVDTRSSDGPSTFQDLRGIVPLQQVAPAKFDVVQDRIVVALQAPQKLPEDVKNIAAALDHIRGSGNKLIENLRNSNCDPRLLESVEELQEQLVTNSNIIKIGLTNLGCSLMCVKFQEELPDAVVAMFNSYNVGVSQYAAQFPEWELFSQKAASIDLIEDDIVAVDAAAEKIIAFLEETPSLAHPDVPETIAFIRNFLSSPVGASKRATFAAIRTIENLVASILHYAVDFFAKTAEKVVEKGSTAAAGVIVGLLVLALVGASGISQAAMHAGAPWVKQAAEILQKQIEKMSE